MNTPATPYDYGPRLEKSVCACGQRRVFGRSHLRLAPSFPLAPPKTAIFSSNKLPLRFTLTSISGISLRKNKTIGSGSPDAGNTASTPRLRRGRRCLRTVSDCCGPTPNPHLTPHPDVHPRSMMASSIHMLTRRDDSPDLPRSFESRDLLDVQQHHQHHQHHQLSVGDTRGFNTCVTFPLFCPQNTPHRSRSVTGPKWKKNGVRILSSICPRRIHAWKPHVNVQMNVTLQNTGTAGRAYLRATGDTTSVCGRIFRLHASIPSSNPSPSG